jgi:Domain of unknown function (DUF4082)/Bacterial Ig-like domain/HYR domain/Bacterial Ig domain
MQIGIEQPVKYASAKHTAMRFLFSTNVRICCGVVAVIWGFTAARAQNPIVLENQLPGSPSTQWDINGVGDTNIQGFATDISVNKGDTVHFKISSLAGFGIQIYRLGYYQGNGARLVADLGSSFTGVVQAVPAPDPDTGLVDCGGWSESASWTVPANAVSGIYIAKLTRNDTSGSSHIVFIVRDDASHSDLFFQASDTTWQAYNFFDGESLYAGTTSYPNGHATKVSYNRPFITRIGGGGGGEDSDAGEDWVFNAEYPMIRWLEANGYDVTYTTDTDSDRRGNLILNHKAFLSVGHDEYWSAAQRANVQAARDAGVSLAFFSGNEIYWKTRWEADGSSASNRTLVCYKEGTLGENVCGDKCDPVTNVWTGLWRDGCSPTYPANDACAPENELSGQISWAGSTGTIQVPDTYKNLRFWRNTSVASLGAGQSATLAANTLGYEWDWQQYNAYYPPGRILLSETVLDGRTHHLSLYKAPGGAWVFGAGTVQWSWGLDGNHDRGGSTPDVSMQQATVNLLADMGTQPGSLQAGLVAATTSTDVQPPVSYIISPVNGNSVPSGNTVVISGVASDVGGGVVAGVQVSLDGGLTWNAAAGTTNWTYNWLPGTEGTVTVESRAFDDSGNIEIPGGSGETANIITVVVTAPALPVCPCTIFQPTDGPDNISASFNDGQPLELGMKFRSSIDGYVTGVRFYKGSLNTGTHIGDLWSSNGLLLAEATFSAETASGWQQVNFGTPIAITSNTTYIVAYHTPAYYSDTAQYFSSPVVDGPLQALADGADGPNGVYLYTATPAFPSTSAQSPYNQANYWVDVVFSTNASPTETVPTVVLVSPAGGTTAVPVNSSVTAKFSEAMDPTTINTTTFELRDSSNALVSATVSYNPGTLTATLTPSAPLAYDTIYTPALIGGASGIKDLAANPLAGNDVWAFTTAMPPLPLPTEGPGGPILVISAAENPFSRYFVEILRAEGLNEFTAMDISLVTNTVLNNYDVVILGDMPLSAPQVSMLTDWVNAGGNLIAMRPDKQLAGLLGLTDASATLSNAYLRIYGTGAGAGIVTNSIQFHGIADRYTLNGATALASLYSNVTTDTLQPAVTVRSVGSNGGHAAAFTFDLARSVVYTRQGNPAWSGQERDGLSPIRSDDLFFGNASFDPEPDWVDLNKVAIPQADEQQRLLANLILQMNADRKPLPRFWYFPKGLKAVVLMTGDDHGNGGTVGRFQQYEADSPTNGSVADWECVRSSSYIYPGTPITDAQATAFAAAGFEIGTHVYTGCADWTPDQLASDYTDQVAQVAAQLPGITPAVSERTHCIAWSDWATQPKVELTNGIRLDLNYYYWPPTWVQNRPGFFTGSGMPMRFADLDGAMIDVYQATTQMTDESDQSYPFTIDSLLDGALGPQGYYGVFAANMHTDYAASSGSDAIIASAQARGVPVVSGRQMLEWLDGRNHSSFGSITWDGGVLGFTVVAASGARNIQAMIPSSSSVGMLSGITLDGNAVVYTNQIIKGVAYAFFAASNGTYQATYASATTQPVISAVTATPGLGGTAIITWTTDEPADSRVSYGTDSNSLTLTAYDASLVTSHNVALTGLALSTTYYFQVASTDAFDNSATSPASPAPPASFITPSAAFVDTTVADFSAGIPDANSYISQTADGEVILNPTVGAEFSGSTLPAGWASSPWGGGGAASVAGGSLTVDGAIAETTGSYGPGRSLEFVATFGAAPFQHVGFLSDISSDAPWAIFSTLNTSTSLYARTALTGVSSPIDTLIPGNWIGSPHRYRIDWTTTNVVFSIDGTPVATNSTVISTSMSPAASDFNTGGPTLSVDWLRMSPYPAMGTFGSRVFDAGSAANWGTLSWTGPTPSGTSLALSYRIGNTPTPDASWTAFTPVATTGGALAGNARYFQYSAQLATSDPNQTPELEDVTVGYNLNQDNTPPAIIALSPAPGSTGVPTNTTVTVSFNEPMNTASLTTSSFRLRLVGDSTDVAATVSCPGTTATLTPNSPLFPGQTYQVTLTGTVSDANGNSLGSSTVWTFFTTPAAASQTDTTVADFSAGTPGGCSMVVSEVGDGELILAPTLDQEFPGTSLPSDWTSGNWSGGGSVTVGGGLLTVDGAFAETTAAYAPGGSLEFVATFGAKLFQHIGFASDDSFSSFAMFSTASTSTTLFARTSDGSNISIPGNWLGSPHHYRIDWTASSVDFWIDGVQVASHAVSLGANMRPIVSDFNVGAPGITEDWMRLSPYTTPCTFTSRVMDAGQSVTWSTLTWTALTPTGTTLAMSYRTGNTPTPDGSWTVFAPVNTSGDALNGSSRYLQYAAQLATSDSNQTPVLEDATVTYFLCSPPIIVGNPSSTTNCLGDPVTFSVTATGSGLAYQWRKDGTNINGAMGSSYTIDSAGTSDAGSYDVIVSAACGTPAISSPASLTVNTPPTITCPANIVVPAALNQCSASVTFAATATGSPTPAITYQTGSTTITSPYVFPVGTTTVNCTASNSCSIAACTFTVTVTNVTPPELTLTAPAGASADTNCQAVVPVVAYQVNDHCDNTPTVTQTPLPGTFVSEGTTVITVVATDASSLFTTRTTTFTVSDTTPPVVVVHPITVTLDASCHYTLTPSEIAALVAGSSDNCGVAGTNVSQTRFTFCDVGATTVQVTLTDVHGNAANADAIVNVQAPANPLTVVYVDASYGTNCGPVTFPNLNGGGTNFIGYNAFNSIQAAVNAVAAGGSVNVAAGTYPEVVVVNKSLTLLGAQAGQNSSSRFAAFGTGANGPKAEPPAESILTAASTGPANAANDTLHIMADNVTVDGFVLDGNNPTLSQVDAVVVGGINTDVRRAIQTEDAAGNFFSANNVMIKNNIIQNFAQRGIELANPSDTSPATSGSLIQGNLIRNFGFDGILLAFNAYSDIVSNTVDMAQGAEAGIWLQDFPNNGASSKTLDWSHNTVTVCQDGFGGIWANLFYAPAATLNIHDNSVNAAAGVTGDDDYTFGIYLSSLEGGTTASLSNNIVGATGGQFARGLALWNVPTTVKPTVTGGTVGHALKGVSLHYNDPNFGTAGASYTVDLSAVNVAGNEVGVWIESVDSGSDSVQMQISGNTTSTACNTGIYVLGANAAANIHDNTASLTGNRIGLSADAGKVFIENNDLTGNTIAGILATNGAVVDAGNCGADVTGFGTSAGGNNLSGYLTGPAKAVINANTGGLPVVLADRDNFGVTGPADNLAAAFSGAVEYSQNPAVFSCPAPVTVTCIGEVPLGAETLADLIAQGAYYTASAAIVNYSDTPHPVSSGTFTRTYTVVDACGTSNTCTQIITISDTIPPTIDSLPNLSFGADPDGCSKQNVTWTVNAHDNCALLSVVSLPPSGSIFNLGTTVVTNIATDTSSNTTITTFTVAVTNATPPELSLTAPAGVTADTNCQAVVPVVAYQVNDHCDNTPTVTQTPPPGTFVSGGTTIITVVATDAGGISTTRTTTLTVSDITAPLITWSFTNLVLHTTSDSCETNMPDVTGTNYLVAYDSCSGTNLVLTQSPTNGAVLPEGTNWVVIAVADQAGNTNYSTNTIVVVDATPPSATVPADIVQANDPGQCGAVVNFILPDQTDNCGVADQVATPASGSFFEVGTTPVMLVVTDINGNTSTNAFQVTVNDAQLPVIQSISNIIQAVDAGQDYATVAFTPIATDNCGLADLKATPPSGSHFPIGTNTVTVVATDVHGNSATNTFTVAVLVPVTITAQPASQTVYIGGTASFGVTASGTQPFTYQWNFNQTNIVNATNAVLVLTNVQPNQAGQYSVLVANAINSVLSSNALLTVNSPPTLNITQSGNYVLVFWPANAPGFVLEATPVLSPADWVQVPDSPLQIGNQYLELIPMTETNQFYRLRFGP